MKHFIILTTLILLSSNVLYSQTDNKTLYRSENRPLIPIMSVRMCIVQVIQ